MGILSLDIIILIILFLILFFSAFKFGKKILVTLILSIYPTLIIFQNFSFLKIESGLQEAIIFLIIYLLIIMILRQNISAHRLHNSFRKILDYGVLSFFYLAMIISISSHGIVSLQRLYTFGGAIPDFVNKIDFSLMLIIPIILILITNKRDNN